MRRGEELGGGNQVAAGRHRGEKGGMVLLAEAPAPSASGAAGGCSSGSSSWLSGAPARVVRERPIDLDKKIMVVFATSERDLEELLAEVECGSGTLTNSTSTSHPPEVGGVGHRTGAARVGGGGGIVVAAAGRNPKHQQRPRPVRPARRGRGQRASCDGSSSGESDHDAQVYVPQFRLVPSRPVPRQLRCGRGASSTPQQAPGSEYDATAEDASFAARHSIDLEMFERMIERLERENFVIEQDRHIWDTGIELSAEHSHVCQWAAALVAETGEILGDRRGLDEDLVSGGEGIGGDDDDDSGDTDGDGDDDEGGEEGFGQTAQRGGTRHKHIHLDIMNEDQAVQLLQPFLAESSHRKGSVGGALTTREKHMLLSVFRRWLELRAVQRCPLLRCFHSFELMENWKHSGHEPGRLSADEGDDALRGAYAALMTLRQDLDRARTVLDVVKRRERLKRESCKATFRYWETALCEVEQRQPVRKMTGLTRNSAQMNQRCARLMRQQEQQQKHSLEHASRPHKKAKHYDIKIDTKARSVARTRPLRSNTPRPAAKW